MNYLKTAILLAGLTALFGAVGYAVGGEQGMVMALTVALAMNIFSYWFSDRMVLRMYGAKQATSGAVHDMVQELAHDAGLPPPKVYMVETPQPNAFATGRNPSHAAVAVTHGIMDVLNAQELRAVIAHELTHVKNRDTLTMTITATIAGALSMLTNFGMYGGGNRGRGVVGTLAMVILAPLAAMLVQMAISRTREYAADRGGAIISEDPMALASALEKIDYAARRVDNHLAERNPATAHMFIINPLHMRAMDNLFSTHPNTTNRIRALEAMAQGTSHPSHAGGPWDNR